MSLQNIYRTSPLKPKYDTEIYQLCRCGRLPAIYRWMITHMRISKDGKVNLKEIRGRQCMVTSKIFDGYFYFGCHSHSTIYLVVYVGFLIRMVIDVPLKYLKVKTDMGHQCIPLTLTDENETKPIRLSKGDFITFPTKILAI